MSTTYWISVTLHVFAALVWLGGMFFLALVGAPVLRTVNPPALRQQLFQALGVRFRTVGWWAIAVLVVTGFVNLYHRGLLRWKEVLAEPAFWGSSLGRALAAKLIAVTVILAASALHDFVLGPAAGRIDAASPEAARMRRRAALLARGSAVLAIVIVIAAVRLARGG